MNPTQNFKGVSPLKKKGGCYNKQKQYFENEKALLKVPLIRNAFLIVSHLTTFCGCFFSILWKFSKTPYTEQKKRNKKRIFAIDLKSFLTSRFFSLPFHSFVIFFPERFEFNFWFIFDEWSDRIGVWFCVGCQLHFQIVDNFRIFTVSPSFLFEGVRLKRTG